MKEPTTALGRRGIAKYPIPAALLVLHAVVVTRSGEFFTRPPPLSGHAFGAVGEQHTTANPTPNERSRRVIGKEREDLYTLRWIDKACWPPQACWPSFCGWWRQGRDFDNRPLGNIALDRSLPIYAIPTQANGEPVNKLSDVGFRFVTFHPLSFDLLCLKGLYASRDEQRILNPEPRINRLKAFA
jgi:hypothetical protein